MEMNEQGQVNVQDQAQDSKAEINSEELMNKVRAEVKAELDGLNRKIGELTREKEQAAEAALKEAEAKLSVSERLEKMEREFREAKEEVATEKTKSIMTKTAISMISEVGLPASVIDKINIKSEESIIKDIEFFKDLLIGTEKSVKDDVRKKHAFKPGGGDAKPGAPKSLAECKTKEDKIAYFRAQRG